MHTSSRSHSYPDLSQLLLFRATTETPQMNAVHSSVYFQTETIATEGGQASRSTSQSVNCSFCRPHACPMSNPEASRLLAVGSWEAPAGDCSLLAPANTRCRFCTLRPAHPNSIQFVSTPVFPEKWLLLLNSTSRATRLCSLGACQK